MWGPAVTDRAPALVELSRRACPGRLAGARQSRSRMNPHFHAQATASRAVDTPILE